MQVGHRFASVRAVVDHEPIARVLQAELGGDFRGFQKQMSQHLMIDRISFGDARNDFLGHDQDVDRRVRVYVFESQHKVVFINNLRGDLPGRDLLKRNSHEQNAV